MRDVSLDNLTKNWAADIPPDQLEIYTQFGITAEMAQVLEVEAGNVALDFIALFTDTDKITPEQTEWFGSLFEDLNRKTLGQLLRSVKKVVKFDGKTIEIVDEALVKRNYLMHRFFPHHNFALFSAEGRREMRAELDEIQMKLSLAHAILRAMSGSLLHLKSAIAAEMGQVLSEKYEEYSEREIGRFIARGRRLRGI